MPLGIDDVERFGSEVVARLDADGAVTAAAEARRQEIRAAIALLQLSVATGSRDKMLSACNRLEQLARFKSNADHRWIAAKLEPFRSSELAAPNTRNDPQERRPAMNDSGTCDVLVVTALFEPELEQFIARLANLREFIGGSEPFLASRTYYRGTLHARQRGDGSSLNILALFQDRMGMVECATVVANAIALWRPRLVAMTGVCAGRAEAGVKLNDIVVPSAMFTYDTGKRTVAGFLREPLWSEIGQRVIQRVRVRGASILREMAADIRQAFPGNVAMPAVHTDVMACGSSVIDLPGAISKVAGIHRKVVALDMESYAFVRATQMSDPRVQSLVVKGVMDLSHDKSDGMKAEAAAWAATFLARFIESEFDALCEP